MALSIMELAVNTDNPNIGEQLREWQIARTQANQDAYDWANFREHVLAIGAPDPGDTEPTEFRQYDWTKYAVVEEQATTAQSASAPSSSSASAASVGSTGGKKEEHHGPFAGLFNFLRRK